MLKHVLERARRPVLAFVVGTGFIAAGLWITGGAARVSALVRAAVSAPGIELYPGSRSGTPRSVVFDGQPARVRRCVAPAGTRLENLRDHYDQIATRESDCGNGRTLPHASSVENNIAFVLWASPRDGHRKGVIAQNEAGLINYTLVDSEPLPGDRTSLAMASHVYLPGGLVAPEGSTGAFCLEDGPQGYAFFESPGSSDSVAGQLRASLEKAHFQVDDKVQPELETAREAGPRAGSSSVVIAFQGKDRKGYFVVSPARPGTSRVTLALR